MIVFMQKIRRTILAALIGACIGASLYFLINS